METPKLPSIQLMLQGVSAVEDNKHVPYVTHPAHDAGRPVPLHPHPEMSGLMQNLTISPQPVEPSPFYHQKRNMHTRSFSDYTLQYPPTRTNTLCPGSYHRRAVSTNAIDHLIHPPQASPMTSTSASTVASQPPQSPVTDDDSSDCSSSSDKQKGPKYHCPYCKKGFSRPSSLRIHTYSHTGEKPFVCPEDGCSRKFSVQSNMRRHMRVHQLGRPMKRSERKSTVNGNWINVSQSKLFSV